jgi:hypothetical protein
MGASDPEIIRAKVPLKDVSKWFPPGTELRILSPEEFESRAQAALQTTARIGAGQPLALTRARHHARWNAGLLSGRSELVFRANPQGATDFILQPWSPAILSTEQSAKFLRSGDSGPSFLRIGHSTRDQVLILDWELKARPHSRGRRFSLALPGNDTSVLELEIPKRWVPSSQANVRRGPIPVQDSPLSLWEIDAQSGHIDIQLRDDQEQSKAAARTRGWLTSTTEVDLHGTSDRADGLVNWTTDFRLDLDPQHPGRLEVELDPGLELIDVKGPMVRGFGVERHESATRAVVALEGGWKTAALLRFLAHADIPSEGCWRIPAMRPLNATWTGGITKVILDEHHTLRAWREKAGRLVGPGRASVPPDGELTFEADSPQSVAELDLLRPAADLACEVRGTVDFSVSPIRLECRLNWMLHSGRVHELELEMSPAWVLDQVSIEGVDDPFAWHASALPSGGTKLHVVLPSSILTSRNWTLILGANATGQAGRGPVQLPRVRATSAKVVDEAWLAWADDATMVQPIQAHGLAWIDPVEVSGLVTPNRPSNLREALAWRWIAPEAQAQVDCLRGEQGTGVSIRQVARIAPTARELFIDGSLVVGSGSTPVASVPVWIDQPGDLMTAWHFRDGDGNDLLARPVDERARSQLGFPKEGSAFQVQLNRIGPSQQTVSFQARLPWISGGFVPLVSVARDRLQHGTILVEMPAGMNSRAEVSGMTRIDPTAVNASGTSTNQEAEDEEFEELVPTRSAVVHAFDSMGTGARLQLFTEPLVPAPVSGIIQEAVLTTSVGSSGRSLNRLRLLVRGESLDMLDLILPPELVLVRVRGEGQNLAPLRSGTHLLVPLGNPSQGSRSSAIVLDYEIRNQTIADGARLRPIVPDFHLPCLSFIWRILTPPGWRAVDPEPALIAVDRQGSSEWPCEALGLWHPAWNNLRRGAGSAEIQRLRVLDDRLLHPASERLTFAEWLSRWDSGSWPVIVDRLALEVAGLGPKSSCVPSRNTADRRSISLATLQTHGLALVPFPDVLLITTEAEAARFQHPGDWSESIRETMVWGCDRTDRLETLPRWRGESSPSSGAAPEDVITNRTKPPLGWSAWTFSKPLTRGDDAFVHLIDARRRAALGWIVVVLCLSLLLIPGTGTSRWRSPAMGAVVLGTVILDQLLPSRFASITAGGFAGGLAALILQLSRQAWASRHAGSGSDSSIVRRVGAPIVSASLTLLLLLKIVSGQATAQAGNSTEPPVLAFFPYEGSFDPARPVDRVFLRLEDFTRLCRWGEARQEPPPSNVWAVAAVHHVERVSAQNILVSTELQLMAEGQPPFLWEIPVALTRDIQATLDGRAQPVSIEPGGIKARVWIPRSGSHVLRLSRSAAAKAEAAVERLDLSINAIPSARLIVEPPRDGIPQGEVTAYGRTELQPDQTLISWLGPTDRIDLRWAKPLAPTVPRHQAPSTG